MSLLRIDASILGPHSSSRQLADIVQEQWLAAHAGATVVRRDLAAEPIPATYWPAAVGAGHTPRDHWSSDQKAATALAMDLFNELNRAETIIVATGLYNWGINQFVKGWIDLVVTAAPRGGQFLAGKDVALVVTRGGYYGDDGPKAGWDHGTPWLVRIFSEVWGAKVTVVHRDFTLVGVNPALDGFKDQAAALKARALETSASVGKALAASYAARKPA